MGKRKDVQGRPEICRVEISPRLTPPVAGPYLLAQAWCSAFEMIRCFDGFLTFIPQIYAELLVNVRHFPGAKPRKGK